MGLLAATLAHEVRNPLASISTNGETLRAMLGESDARLRYVDSILDEVERLESVVSSMLRFAGRERLIRRRVELQDVVEAVLDRSRERAERQGVEVTTRGEPCRVTGDRDLLERLLANVVRNALDAMPDGGRLTLTLTAIPLGGAILEIADTGEGLPDIDEVFEPFFTTRTRGVGLGLPLARQIAERHGGSLSALPVEEGCTLRLVLPEVKR
jgi:two-component system sensor histidine kinase HydH